MGAERRALEARNRELTELNERLVQSERRYREVFENITAGIVVLEVAEGGRFKVISANPAVRNLTGIHESVAEGRFLDELVPKETAERLSEGYRRCIENGSPISVENSLQFPSETTSTVPSVT